jgi:uncharacterized protein (TIGR03437 family)
MFSCAVSTRDSTLVVAGHSRGAAVGAVIDGIDAPVEYAGGAPGLVNGVMQVNVRIPHAVTAGIGVPIEVYFGDAGSQAGVTLSVR